MERLEHPRLMAAVLKETESLERSLPCALIRRQRRHYEFEPGFAVGIFRTGKLNSEYLLRAWNFANGQLQRHINLIGLGEGEAWDLLVATPDAFEPCQAIG